MQHAANAEQIALLDQACKRFPNFAELPAVLVNITKQKLTVVINHHITAEYPISTSRLGAGQKQDSNQTPLGIHCVQEKIGGQAEFAEIFNSRKRSYQCANIVHQAKATNEEYITSRILWLKGLEPGFNQGEGVDSYTRYIYIHGTHEEGLIGQPASIGCIRMKNQDVIDLFECLEVSSLVIITE